MAFRRNQQSGYAMDHGSAEEYVSTRVAPAGDVLEMQDEVQDDARTEAKQPAFKMSGNRPKQHEDETRTLNA